jgi:hypothetical protein
VKARKRAPIPPPPLTRRTTSGLWALALAGSGKARQRAFTGALTRQTMSTSTRLQMRAHQTDNVCVNAFSPSPRTFPSMAYDDTTRTVVLFGGYDRRNGSSRRFGDTWEWDGHRWERIDVEGPAPRNNAAMVDDAARRRVLLFGGSTGRASGEPGRGPGVAGNVWARPTKHATTA